jgi:hypothetical protein
MGFSVQPVKIEAVGSNPFPISSKAGATKGEATNSIAMKKGYCPAHSGLRFS